MPQLELGAFEERPAVEAARLRLAQRLAIPPSLLARAAGRDERFLRSYAFWHAARRALRDDGLWRRLTRGTTVLMYHAFGAEDERPSRFVVPVAAFERQLRWLRRRRTLIDLRELAACRREGRLPPADAVAITIDDGYADVLRVAPLLHRYGVPATLYVVTAKIGGVNDWEHDGALAGRRLLSWEELRGLADDGVSIGAHTRRHPQLTLLRTEEARAEIAGSRDDVERRLATTPETFAYPYGRVSDAVEGLAADAGFALSCGLERGRNGPATPRQALRRVEIEGPSSFRRFMLAVSLAEPRALRHPFRMHPEKP